MRPQCARACGHPLDALTGKVQPSAASRAAAAAQVEEHIELGELHTMHTMPYDVWQRECAVTVSSLIRLRQWANQSHSLLRSIGPFGTAPLWQQSRRLPTASQRIIARRSNVTQRPVWAHPKHTNKQTSKQAA